jgi:hypothetical protein
MDAFFKLWEFSPRANLSIMTELLKLLCAAAARLLLNTLQHAPPISPRPTLQLSLSPPFPYYRFRPARHYRSNYGQFAPPTHATHMPMPLHKKPFMVRRE